MALGVCLLVSFCVSVLWSATVVHQQFDLLTCRGVFRIYARGMKSGDLPVGSRGKALVGVLGSGVFRNVKGGGTRDTFKVYIFISVQNLA